MLNDYQTFGYSANVDFAVDKSIKEVVLNQNKMEEFSRTLIQAIDMKLHKIDGKESFLIDKWAGDDHPQTFGVSACGFLTTSSYSLHTSDNGCVMLDIFSCKNFEFSQIKDVVKDTFGDVFYIRCNKMTRIIGDYNIYKDALL